MALLANRLAPGVIEMPWIDYGAVDGLVRGVCVCVQGLCLLALAAFRDMQSTRSVATLAADGVAPKDRLFITIQRVRHRIDAIAVAEQAIVIDRPREVSVGAFVAGRERPAFVVLRIPRDRRHEKQAALVDEIGAAALPRADGEIDIDLAFEEGVALFVDGALTMAHAFALTLDVLAKGAGGKGTGGIGALQARRRRDRRQRSAHRMLTVGAFDVAVAAGAHLIAHVLDVGMDVGPYG